MQLFYLAGIAWQSDGNVVVIDHGQTVMHVRDGLVSKIKYTINLLLFEQALNPQVGCIDKLYLMTRMGQRFLQDLHRDTAMLIANNVGGNGGGGGDQQLFGG